MRLTPCAVLIAFAGVLTAQTPPVLENEHVRVLRVVAQPHSKSRLHKHDVNRVMIYLQAGREDIVYEDGRKEPLNWKAGEVQWTPAKGMHTAEITSDQPVTIIEVEIKKPGSKSHAADSALAPLKVDPKHYKLEFENDQVRVTRVKIGPGESTPVHEHTMNRLVAYISDQNFRITSADGKVDNARHNASDVSWSGAAKHKEENLAATPFEVVVVELKN